MSARQLRKTKEIESANAAAEMLVAEFREFAVDQLARSKTDPSTSLYRSHRANWVFGAEQMALRMIAKLFSVSTSSFSLEHPSEIRKLSRACQAAIEEWDNLAAGANTSPPVRKVG